MYPREKGSKKNRGTNLARTGTDVTTLTPRGASKPAWCSITSKAVRIVIASLVVAAFRHPPVNNFKPVRVVRGATPVVFRVRGKGQVPQPAPKHKIPASPD